MVIDYSRWDNITTSSEEEDEEEDEEEAPSGSTAVGVAGPIAAAAASTTTRARLSGGTPLSDADLEHIPKIVLLVRSTNRDRILDKMISNDLVNARPFGAYGISLPGMFLNDGHSFASFFSGCGTEMVAKIAASLLFLSTEDYLSSFGNRIDFKDGMCSVPYDAQFRGDPFEESTLHVRYGQERQALYQHVAGPEFKECKMGPTCGGPVVLVQAKMRMAFGGLYEEYVMETIDVEAADIPTVVTELLDIPTGELAY